MAGVGFKFSREDYYSDSNLPEFNQMGLYLTRIDKRQDERDTALNTGKIVDFYRCSLALLMNCIPKFIEKNIPFEEVKKGILDIGKRIKTQNLDLLKKNSLQIEEDLWEQNIKLNELMFNAGMIYPEKEYKSYQEKAREDFEGKA